MKERDLQAEEAFARCCVDQLHAFSGERGQRCAQIVDLVGHVMHPRAALGQELAHRRVVAGWREQLDTAVADEHGSRLDALGENRRAMLDPGAEKTGIRSESLVEVADRDSDVMNAADVHASDANEGSSHREELEAVAEWVRGVKALVSGKLAVPADLADALGEQPKLVR